MSTEATDTLAGGRKFVDLGLLPLDDGRIGYQNWKVYADDARNARLWFEGYCELAGAGLRLLVERDRLRHRLRAAQAGARKGDNK